MHKGNRLFRICRNDQVLGGTDVMGSINLRKVLLWPALIVGIAWAVAGHAETCQKQVDDEISAMRKQQDVLRSGPYENGPIQELGQCTRQAIRLGVAFGARGPGSEQQAAKEELANCLQLRILAIGNSCFCRQIGADIGRDLDMQGLAGQMQDVGSAYQRMTQAAERARQRAIQNPLIQQYVAEAEKFRQCYDRLAINTLDGLAKKLDALDPGDSTASAGGAPTVDAPVPGTSGPPATAPATAARGPNVNVPAPSANALMVNTPPVNTATAGAPAAVPTTTSSPPAGNCTDLRNDIAAMDAQSNAMPGYIGMRVQLASLYNSLCGSGPAQRTQYWYTTDGKQLQAVSAGPRPAGAAYAATADIGAQCAGTANPGMCALAAGAFGNCQTPPSDLQQACSVPGGYADPSDTVAATGGPPLPDAQLTVDGKTYDVSDGCAQALARISDGYASNAQLNSCSGALRDALAQAAGAARSALATALGPVLQRGFAPAGAPPTGGFSAAFCQQMENNAQICKTRQNNMVSCIPTGNAQQPCAPQDNTSTSGQAGAFGDCYQLYSRFAGMCRMNVNQRPQIAAASAPRTSAPTAQPAKPATPQPTVNPSAPASPKPTANAAPPPAPARPQMSPQSQCPQLVSNFVAAAQANDGARALAGYNALKAAGGCGVLAKVDRPPPAVSSVDDLPSRGATPLSDQVIGGCARAQDGCAAQARQLQAGTSPAAQAAMIGNAIGIGLQLGGMMASGMAAGMPQGGGNVAVPSGGSNMNSIGNRPVQSTYGQGAPTYQPRPPTSQSTITGIGAH